MPFLSRDCRVWLPSSLSQIYFLSQIWTGGDQGRQLFKSDREKEIALGEWRPRLRCSCNQRLSDRNCAAMSSTELARSRENRHNIGKPKSYDPASLSFPKRFRFLPGSSETLWSNCAYDSEAPAFHWTSRFRHRMCSFILEETPKGVSTIEDRFFRLGHVLRILWWRSASLILERL
jgi:hypothetical protein